MYWHIPVVSPSTKVIKFQLITTCVIPFHYFFGCFTFYKGNKISANHNSRKADLQLFFVVSPSTKVIKFQLITTVNQLAASSGCCFTFYKGNKISANHNQGFVVVIFKSVVSPSTKVIKFQLITTLTY